MPLNLNLSGNCAWYNYPSEDVTPPINPNPQEKKYSFKPSIRRKIYDTAINGLIQTKLKKSNLYFITLTYRESKKHTASNSHISELLEYLDKKESPYKRGGFMWVKEMTKKETPHFHLLIDLKFRFEYSDKAKKKKAYLDVKNRFNYQKALGVAFEKLSERWEVIRKDISKDHRSNGLDVERIHKATGIIYYLTKYLTKEKLIDSKSKVWARSHDWIITKQVIECDDTIEYFVNKVENFSKNANKTENPFYNAVYSLHWRVSVYESIKFYYPHINLKELNL